MAKTWSDTKFTERDRTTKEDHDWLKENHKRSGFKSAAAYLSFIINKHREGESKMKK